MTHQIIILQRDADNVELLPSLCVCPVLQEQGLALLMLGSLGVLDKHSAVILPPSLSAPRMRRAVSEGHRRFGMCVPHAGSVLERRSSLPSAVDHALQHPVIKLLLIVI